MPEADREITLKDAISQEGAGILNWALDGLDRLRKRGHFSPPKSVLDATANFKGYVDVPAAFVDEMCDVDPSFTVQSSVLYNTYQTWCKQNGHRYENNTSIANDWKRLGFTNYPSNGRKMWKGVKIR